MLPLFEQKRCRGCPASQSAPWCDLCSVTTPQSSCAKKTKNTHRNSARPDIILARPDRGKPPPPPSQTWCSGHAGVCELLGDPLVEASLGTPSFMCWRRV